MMDVACVMCRPRLYFDAGAISLDTGSLRSGLVRSSAIDLMLSRESCLRVHCKLAGAASANFGLRRYPFLETSGGGEVRVCPWVCWVHPSHWPKNQVRYRP
jgi:hypothetical protein